MHLLVHPAAECEMAHALAWARQNFGAAVSVRLAQRIGQAGELLLREPDLGTPAAAGTRQLPLTGYPYSLVYRVTGRVAGSEVMHVLAFRHHSRLPNYWKRRR